VMNWRIAKNSPQNGQMKPVGGAGGAALK
jgi:hypothetical protein